MAFEDTTLVVLYLHPEKLHTNFLVKYSSNILQNNSQWTVINSKYPPNIFQIISKYLKVDYYCYVLKYLTYNLPKNISQANISNLKYSPNILQNISQ